MVQEIERRKPELQVLSFLDLEAFIHGQIAIYIGRPVNIGQSIRTVLEGTDRIITGYAKAASVDVLVREEVLCGVTEKCRLQVDVRRAKYRSIIDCGSDRRIHRNRNVLHIHAEVGSKSRQVWTALQAANPGDGPIVGQSTHELIYPARHIVSPQTVPQLSQIDLIRRVEKVTAIKSQHAVVVCLVRQV